MIKTKQIQYTPKILFKYWLQQFWKRLIPLLVIFFALVNFFYYLLFGAEHYFYFWYIYAGIALIATLILTGLKLFLVWRTFTNKENKVYYKSFHHEFDNDFIKTFFEDKGNSSIPWNDVLKIIITKSKYALYIAKDRAFFLTEKDFQNSEDFKKFLGLLKEKKLLKSEK